MGIFKFIGVSLIIIGIVSAGLIFLTPFGVHIEGSINTLWLLFSFCFIGGAILYGLGDMDSKENLIKICGSILLLIGLISAASILLAKIRILKAEETGNLWILFLVCIITGFIAIIYIKE